MQKELEVKLIPRHRNGQYQYKVEFTKGTSRADYNTLLYPTEGEAYEDAKRAEAGLRL